MSQLSTLIKKRAAIKATVTRFKTYLSNIESNDKSVLEIKMQRLEAAYKEFEEIQLEIEALDTEKEDIDHDERDSFDKKYYEAMSMALKELSSSRTPSSQTTIATTVDNPRVQLPVINLPSFEGSYENWMYFHDSFASMIHNNNNLTKIQKFQYLRSCLKGTALQVIQSIELSDNNYEVAYDLLKERFENKRLLIFSHIDSLFNMPKVEKENHIPLNNLLNTTLKNIRTLKLLGEPTESWDRILIYLITNKFDNNTLREWENSLPSDNKQLPSMSELEKFLRRRCEFLERINKKPLEKLSNSFQSVEKTKKSAPINSQLHHKLSTKSYVSSVKTYTCKICKGNHYLFACQQFKTMGVQQRIEEIQRLRLCHNCFRDNHKTEQCLLQHCKKCSSKHHTLLHVDNTENIPNAVTTLTSIKTENISNRILLSTAVVEIFTIGGDKINCRVLLDSGSESNFITENLFKKLGLPAINVNIPVEGINNTNTSTKGSVRATIKSKFTPFQTTLDLLVVERIAEKLPAVDIDISSISIPATVHLADSQFNITRPVDLLIGAEIFYDLLCIGQIKTGRNSPTLQKTQFGWIISGPINQSYIHNKTRCHVSTRREDVLHDQLRRFWEIEEINCPQELAFEDDACENHFKATHIRQNTGRYEVRLPFKENITSLGESRTMALNRFHSLERRFRREQNIKKQYVDFMSEYIQLGHMEIVEDDNISSIRYYLPHHPVLKEESTTTKLRVVFDGSAQTSSGISLNDTLMKGPTIQDDLTSIILRFRTHNYAMTADIAKMYRQIRVNSADANFQGILWRSDSSQPIKTYKLTTVTYGTTTAPFLATRCLKQLAEDEKLEYPTASSILEKDFYVDDLLTGVETSTEAIALKSQLTSLLGSGGFELRKWRSNSPEITVEDSCKEPCSSLSLDTNTIKTLGLWWHNARDVLLYKAKNFDRPLNGNVTKRNILSKTAQIFDPLGLLGPIITIPKLLIQNLWQLSLTWDQPVPNNIAKQWENFEIDLLSLNNLEIPRRIIPFEKHSDLELHGFSDASEKAYGACVYIRSSNGHEYCSRLLCSKSRVAPLKNISLPRLELCGAVLLTQLITKVKRALGISFNKTYCWTDSTIVLAWLAAPSNNWKTFVANRVAEIHRTIDSQQWFHIRSHDNPADILSRGTTLSNLKDNINWWNGPDWLQFDSSEWPEQPPCFSTNAETLEKRTVLTVVNNKPFDVLSRYSSFNKLKRVIAYCLRFKYNAPRETGQSRGALTVGELERATSCILKLIQQECFEREIKELSRTNTVANNSRLKSLNPFLDSNGLIRVGGRLRHSSLPFDQRHPILLPSSHHVTKLIIKEEHLRLLHAGPQTLLASLRTKYWPLSGRSGVRQITRTCVTCFRCKPTSAQQLMGDLPEKRIQPVRPFTTCGVDYCGPINLREGRRRGRICTYKSYVAIFVCFATKAVHLEIVTSLSSECFLAALRRFMSRRGKCSHIYSDNGTNFVGANNHLQEVYDFLQKHQDTLQGTLAEERIKWHFIPARSPHFGGLWEAAVKSFKHHMQRICGNALLTYEEYYTLVTQVEACLNSRPLTPISSDPNDLNVLTPAHFLIGDSLTTFPSHNYKEVPVNRLSRWEHIQQCKQHFWSRWSIEYLGELQRRSKWVQNYPENIKPGALVVLREENLPPLQWKLGRIIEVHPGSDGKTRVVSVKTASGTFKRAINKVCILPIDTQ